MTGFEILEDNQLIGSIGLIINNEVNLNWVINDIIYIICRYVD